MVAKPRHGPPSRRPQNGGRRRRPRSRPASEAGHELVKNARERGARRLGQMRVDCGRFNGAVTEQDLYNAENDVACDEPRGVAGAEAMERDAGDAGLACGDRDGTAERPASDRAVTGLVGKEPARVPVGRPEFTQVVENWLRQGDDPLFVTLADDPQPPIDAVHGRNLKPSAFSGTQAAGVDDGWAGPVDRVLQARKEFTDMGIAERIGEPLLLGLADLFFENRAQSRLSVSRYRNWMP